MTSEIKVENLSKRYTLGLSRRPDTAAEMLISSLRALISPRQVPETIWALKDVSFNVKQGEVLGIIGRNGAGKSTLLKVLSRITKPTSGNISVNGRVASLLEVGTGFHEELTGRENVYLCGSILGMPKKIIDAKLESIMAFADVERFIDTPIKRYSTGMRLRLGFAVAANLESDILLIDEVLAVGDAEFQKKCLQRMGDMHTHGRTVLFVSHNLAAIENLCSRVIWIDNGSLRLDGSPQKVIHAYMSSYANANHASGDTLSSIESRSGSGDIRYTRIEYLNTDRMPIDVIRSGDSFVIRHHFDAKRPIEYPIFVLEISTQLGTLIAQMHTYNSGFDIPLLPAGPGCIDLEIGELNLMPGRYTISLRVGHMHDRLYDVLLHCATLNVETSTRYGLARGITGNPLICLPCNWHLGPHAVGDLAGTSSIAADGSHDGISRGQHDDTQ